MVRFFLSVFFFSGAAFLATSSAYATDPGTDSESTALASEGYPTSSDSFQKIRLLHEGPAVLANVSSSYLSKFILAYSHQGYLARTNPETVEAVVSSACYGSRGGKYFQQTIVQLGREWSGAGYASFPLDIWNHVPSICYSGGFWILEVAFSDKAGHWDSKFGQNYIFTHDQLSRVKGTEVFSETPNEWETRGQVINPGSWRFIAEEMRK